MSSLYSTGDDIPPGLRSDCEVQWEAAAELIGVLYKLLRPGGTPSHFAGDVELSQALDIVLIPIVRHIAQLEKATNSRGVRALKERYDALRESYDELRDLFYTLEKDTKILIERIEKANLSLPDDLGRDFNGELVGVN